jgi:hypothetical protein
MPTVEVIFYQDAQGKMPRLIEWLDALPRKATGLGGSHL